MAMDNTCVCVVLHVHAHAFEWCRVCWCVAEWVPVRLCVCWCLALFICMCSSPLSASARRAVPATICRPSASKHVRVECNVLAQLVTLALARSLASLLPLLNVYACPRL
eukprot:15343280-Alexandrium_andersonii.AAC.1